ncbi:hypothetical protein SteCoe_19600 [Stentor coeruleus]|uniref:HPt domain-containing protein n=1 Tax=Stentor coeruleus TaxID=5963 RepID=A0A1R2BUC3_9CILI|nr:hypothetical protein SteCoe_19600 [Stentor coeruleus]
MEENTFINFEEGRKFLSNEHLFFLKRFYEIDLQASKKSLVNAYEKNDLVELKRCAHSLKGTSSYIGALTCRKLSEDLQLLCANTSASKEQITEFTNLLVQHLEDLYKYLKNYFNPIEIIVPPRRKSDCKIESPLVEELKEEQLTLTIKKLIPPVSRVIVADHGHSYEEDEIDILEELNKQWRCVIV